MYSPSPPTDEADDWGDVRALADGRSRTIEASDYDLVVAIVDGGSRAFERFVERFHRILLDYARRHGVPELERDELVGETLSDTAMRFMSRGAVLPRNPRMYLLAAFRRKLANSRRSRGRRHRVVSEAARDALADCDYADDTEIAVGCSEGLLRESRGPGWQGPSLPPVLERLSQKLSEALTEDERQLLVGVADNVPQREIAAWLGISHAGARKRLERLRARLLEVAMRYGNSLEPDDARELRRFFRRCDARMGAQLIIVEGALRHSPEA
jgi:RNA polymerase sigma factor (sigma-70 family)